MSKNIDVVGLGDAGPRRCKISWLKEMNLVDIHGYATFQIYFVVDVKMIMFVVDVKVMVEST